jgi:hypothetical protein
MTDASYRCRILLFLLLAAIPAAAQDVLTLGTGAAPGGGAAVVPVSILDHTGTPLGADAGTGNRIQGVGFKVMFSTDLVSSVSFTRAGVMASPAPLFELMLQGPGYMSYLVSFTESTSPIPFTPDAAAPGDLIGRLTVNLQPSAPIGGVVILQFDPPSAILSNQAGTVRETVALGTLALVNGSVTVNTSPAAPSNLVAAAVTTSQVSVAWTGVGGADHYEIWRRSNGGSFAVVGTSFAPSFSDSTVVAGTTYLYRARAVDSGGNGSAFSNVDAATTVIFTDDPLVAQTTIVKLVHFMELRTAVNAFRVTGGLLPLPADPTLALGQNVRAQHITDLRTGLDEARSANGLGALTYTDSPLTPGTTVIKATHVVQLRNGVK